MLAGDDFIHRVCYRQTVALYTKRYITCVNPTDTMSMMTVNTHTVLSVCTDCTCRSVESDRKILCLAIPLDYTVGTLQQQT